MARSDPWAEFADAQEAPAPQQVPAQKTYTVVTTDGREFDVQAPAGASIQQLQAALKAHGATGEIRPGSYFEKYPSNPLSIKGRVPDRGEKPAADEYVAFEDELSTLGNGTGFRLTPEQEAAVADALQGGDFAKASALTRQFTGGQELNPKVIEYYRNHPGTRPPGWDYTASDANARDSYQARLYRGYDKQPIEELRKNDVLPEQADAFARGAALELDDEIDGIVSSVIHGGSVDDNIARARAIRDYDKQNHPIERIAGGVVGSLALPTKFKGGVGGVGREAAMQALRDARAAGIGGAEARAVAQAAARRAITGQMAKEGALYGTAIGAASGDDLGERAIGAGIGGLTGGAVGGLSGTIGTQAARILPKRQASRDVVEGRELMQAADRLGIDVLPADVAGPVTRRATSMMAQTIVGGQPIISASERMMKQAGAARDRIAETFGQALNPEAAGQEVLSGFKSYRDASRNAARAFYAAAEKATEGFNVTPTKALDALDKHIAELSQTPGGAAGLSTLRQIQKDLKAGKTSVAGIRRMRTALRDEFAKQGLRGSDIERRVTEVIDAAAEDVGENLIDAGLDEAAANFARGDRAWRERAQTIDTVFAPIIGTSKAPRSGEQVIKTLTADLQGNNARAVKLLNSLPAEEQGNVRASIIGALGKAPAGQQNAGGDLFSLQTFLTNWTNVGEKAKAAYFGPEARAALNDLAKVAQGAREAAGYANRSNTGGVLGNLLTLATFSIDGLSSLGATLGSQYALGRLLASPRFARWLARAPKTSLSEPAYIDRLSRIARAEPAIANEVLALQRRLTDALTQGGPARLAAEEPLDEASGVRENQQQQEDQYPGEELPQ